MAKYPIKVLKDEEGKVFVPLVSEAAVVGDAGLTLEEKLNKKLEKTNIKAGSGVSITGAGNDCVINATLPPGLNIIDNLTTEQSGQGILDAHQGKILKDSIPEVVNNLTTVADKKALSAYQGYLLNLRSAPIGGKSGQVLKKANDNDYQFEWGDAADPNAISGDGSITKIINLTYKEYKDLEAGNKLDPNTEYHIDENIPNKNVSLVEDSLTSDSTVNALSANQGRVLNNKFGSYLSKTGGVVSGNVGIGKEPNHALDVKGIINAEDIYKNGEPLKNNVIENGFSGVINPAKWFCIGDFDLRYQGGYVILDCFFGEGQNGRGYQQQLFTITVMRGWPGNGASTTNMGLTVEYGQNYDKAFNNIKVCIKQENENKFTLYLYMYSAYNSLFYNLSGNYTSFVKKHTYPSALPDGVKYADVYTPGLMSYPVGSIYMSVRDVSPASLFGGSWEAIAQGRMIMGTGYTRDNNTNWCGVLDSKHTFYVNETGGQYYHTLNIDEIPVHNHKYFANIQHSDGMEVPHSESLKSGLQVGGRRRYFDGTETSGGGQKHNNTPPYYSVNIWKRTA